MVLGSRATVRQFGGRLKCCQADLLAERIKGLTSTDSFSKFWP